MHEASSAWCGGPETREHKEELVLHAYAQASGAVRAARVSVPDRAARASEDGDALAYIPRGQVLEVRGLLRSSVGSSLLSDMSRWSGPTGTG